MLTDFFIPFIAILFAELGDKTQLAVIALSTRYSQKTYLFLGAFLGFLVIDGVAILFGGTIAAYVSARILTGISGTLFLIFGLLLFRSEPPEEVALDKGNPFVASFLLIFFAELGDKTQLASALLATQYSPLIVFAGVVSALALLTISALFIGKLIAKHVSQKYLSRMAGLIFLLIGAGTLLGLFF